MTRKAKYSKLLPIEVADSKQPLQKAIVNLDDVTIIISKVSFHACLFLFFFFQTLSLILGKNFACFCRMDMRISSY